MLEKDHPIGVMFVCMGNICRSPMAEAVFQHLVDEKGLSTRFHLSSSAVGSWHVGQKPHPGTEAILKQHNIPLHPEKRSELLKPFQLKQYDFILAMDQEIVDNIKSMYGIRLKKLMEFAPDGSLLEVPDPYYDHKFKLVYDLVTAGCEGLLDFICKEYGI